jgi:hypothetical protein
MTALAPPPKLQFFDANGDPLVGGKLYTYEAGTTTPRTTYTSENGVITNPNPIILDSRGEADVWLDPTLAYKFVLKTPADVTIWTVDQIRSEQVTLTNKILVNATFLDGYTEETTTANTGLAYTISLAGGTVQILTLTANCTYTFPTPTAGKSFLLVQYQDGSGARTVTWPATVKWPSSTAPTLTATASKADVFAFTSDGVNWIARVVGQNYF